MKGIYLYFGIFILIIAYFVFFSRSKDSITEREGKSKVEWQNNSSDYQKKIIHDFLVDSILESNDTIFIDGGFYCFWKRGNIEIKPHNQLIDNFRKDGYNVTANKDSMNYLVVCERRRSIVGKYTNGGDATKLGTMISIIDVKNKKYFRILDIDGGTPPEQTQYKHGASGAYISEDNMISYIKDYILKE